jgi:hypothetical protein
MYGGGGSRSLSDRCSDSGDGVCAGVVFVLEGSDVKGLGVELSSSKESVTTLGASETGAAVMTWPGGAPANMTNPP